MASFCFVGKNEKYCVKSFADEAIQLDHRRRPLNDDNDSYLILIHQIPVHPFRLITSELSFLAIENVFKYWHHINRESEFHLISGDWR